MKKNLIKQTVFTVFLTVITVLLPIKAFAADLDGMFSNADAVASAVSSVKKPSDTSVNENDSVQDTSEPEKDQASALKSCENLLSPALNVLAERYGMAKWAPIGNDIYFCEDDFCRALNLATVGSITIVSVPDEKFGTLLLGNTRLTAGQTVYTSNLALIKYVPAAAKSESRNSFEFTCGNSGYTVKCDLYMLSKQNNSPTVSNATGAALSVGTYNGITVYGSMIGYDPDGDPLTYEIVSYPKKGYLSLDVNDNGEYTYTPKANYSGKDSFVYVCRDKYGNYSRSLEVALTVSKRKTSVTYSDLPGSRYECHAVSLTEAGIMSGTQIGNAYYFYPQQTVSRIEFLVMAMNSVGITDVAQVKDTGFYDDNDIPTGMKGYAAAAYRLGYVKGTVKDGELYFCPDDPICRAEAAYILCNLLGLESKTTVAAFADSVPAWASDAVYTMNYYGILRAVEGKISPYNDLSRGEAAEMLDKVMRLF